MLGTLSAEAEKMIEELAEHCDYKHDRKQRRKLRSVQERLKRTMENEHGFDKDH